MSEGAAGSPLPWVRIVTEGAVIVASILLAFAIDAAWDARNDSLRKEALFASLDREMDLAAAELDRVTGFHDRGLAAVVELLSLDPTTELGASEAARIDALVDDAYNSTATYDAPLGTLDALLAAGDLDLLEDDAHLSELTAFPGRVANLEREQGFLVQAALSLLDYLGAAGVDVSQLNAASDVDARVVPWPLRPTTAYSITSEPHFRSLLNEMMWRYQNCIQAMEGMRESIERVRG